MAHHSGSISFAVSRRNHNVNRLLGRRNTSLAHGSSSKDAISLLFVFAGNATRAARGFGRSPHRTALQYWSALICARQIVIRKTLTRKPCRILAWRPRDSCLKTAESMLESRDIHARRRRFSCSNSTKTISKHRENHAQQLRNSRRNPNRALSVPTESRAPLRSREFLTCSTLAGWFSMTPNQPRVVRRHTAPPVIIADRQAAPQRHRTASPLLGDTADCRATTPHHQAKSPASGPHRRLQDGVAAIVGAAAFFAREHCRDGRACSFELQTNSHGGGNRRSIGRRRERNHRHVLRRR